MNTSSKEVGEVEYLETVIAQYKKVLEQDGLSKDETIKYRNLLYNAQKEHDEIVLTMGFVTSLRVGSLENAAKLLKKHDKINEIYAKKAILAEVLQHGEGLGYEAYIHDLDRELHEVIKSSEELYNRVFKGNKK